MKTKQVLDIMKIFSWIIFIGLSIEAGALIISSFVSLFVNPEAAKNLYLGLDLSTLHDIEIRYYLSMLSLIITLAVLKAHMFYLVIKLFSKMNIENPFNTTVESLISRISYEALSIGIIAKIAIEYNKWLVSHRGSASVAIDSGSNEYLFIAGILFIIAYIFKRGIEIQNENDLTI